MWGRAPFAAALMLSALQPFFSLGADSTFDDSYARAVCGNRTPPKDDMVKTLCVEMMEVGRAYAKQLKELGGPEIDSSSEELVEPTHPQYDRVRALGIDVDIRAQELMVLMARAGALGSKNALPGAHPSKLSLVALPSLRVRCHTLPCTFL